MSERSGTAATSTTLRHRWRFALVLVASLLLAAFSPILAASTAARRILTSSSGKFSPWRPMTDARDGAMAPCCKPSSALINSCWRSSDHKSTGAKAQRRPSRTLICDFCGNQRRGSSSPPGTLAPPAGSRTRRPNFLAAVSRSDWRAMFPG